MPFPALLASGLAGGIVASLASNATQIVLKVLASLGFGYLAFSGVDLLVTQNEAQVLQLLGNLPPLAVQLVGVLQLGTCIKILFSAMVMRLTLAGLTAGIFKKMQVVS